MEKYLKKATKYVAKELLNHTDEGELSHVVQVAYEWRCPIEESVMDIVRDLLDEFGEDNGLPEDWYADFDEEEIFFDAYDIIFGTA